MALRHRDVMRCKNNAGKKNYFFHIQTTWFAFRAGLTHNINIQD